MLSECSKFREWSLKLVPNDPNKDLAPQNQHPALGLFFTSLSNQWMPKQTGTHHSMLFFLQIAVSGAQCRYIDLGWQTGIIEVVLSILNGTIL
jgi:hypothetical protein